MTQHDGGPAFPRPATQYIPQTTTSTIQDPGLCGWYTGGGSFYDPGHAGMSLRDYFAAEAMAAFIVSGQPGKVIPAMAYDVADAMLKARETKP